MPVPENLAARGVTEDDKRLAQWLCFKYCERGDFVDPENGCFAPCKTADECEGWITFLSDIPKRVAQS